ncbi:MAG: Nudix family hydrolase [Gammaproteobacteria bacterium]|nr:Nudix family hydrolase [Gammaproteobacteria bacterium]
MPSTAPDGTAARPVIPVAAGCLVDARGEVLICQRPSGKIAAGKWEFPGGKIERGESAADALRRELHEELGIAVRAMRPLIRVRHDYSDRTVVLDTWQVTAWDGELVAHDGQAFAWSAPDRLPEWDLLAADVPIVRALRLPAHYALTRPAMPRAEIERGLAQLPRGALLRLRLPGAADAEYAALARALAPRCRERGIGLMLDRDPVMVTEVGARGFHATVARLQTLDRRPVPEGCWFGASCHTRAELERARALGADFAVLGPVKPTATHPEAAGIGWSAFAEAAREANLPVYAIGGLAATDLEHAWSSGAQGIAGISGYWRDSPSAAGGGSRSSAGMP